ncbi:M14 family metallocarboxypeptidase [Aestuariibacter halophilus]|uniref:M14 family metallocarboxypeptidase n=1 Tax=Fluctibacter halophilus TaxID=226011 RepID=A0ABS8G7X9_9ALTE|nr:M14 family metallocarboxypeptidase [Aestuariibacter halophilus]MCC2616633.1 M14 family metallocarboxypeptidase [Aestuariibacter halophilus]
MHGNDYPIGTPGTPWGDAERAAWRQQQSVKRSYRDDVITRLDGLNDAFECVQYGSLPYDTEYPLFALKSRQWDHQRPTALITGGVHGYETSGVHGALQFAEQGAGAYLDKLNLVVCPCVSPWGYETINRWNPEAVDPNRSFLNDSPAPESAALMAFVGQLPGALLVHIDLHETTDTDNSEFRPALAARDGVTHDEWDIPDGFYLVADSHKSELAFQQHIIRAVAKVTQIAPADGQGRLIGEPILDNGIIEYAAKPLGLCMGLSDAPFVTTTEVYPDSPNASPQNCNDAQQAAVQSALDYALGVRS